MAKKSIILAAGGTGGHVFPAFATAEVLREQGHDVSWATDRRGLKYAHHWQGHSPMVISAASPVNKTIFALKMGAGFAHALVSLLVKRPHAVVGFGGYPSVPVVLAAQVLGIPTLVHEANATIGLANRFLGRKAKAIAVSFPDDHSKAILTGNPVRPAIAELADMLYAPGDKLNLLVFGGSLGARIFEQIMPSALAARADIRLTQQVVDDEGRAGLDIIYKDMGIEASLLPFIEDMPGALKAADLVISRSGASTVAELTATGKPAVFIPYAHHGDAQQYANARAAEAAGGAVVIDEKMGIDNAVAQLSQFLASLDTAKLTQMAGAMKALGNPKAAWTLAELIVTKAA